MTLALWLTELALEGLGAFFAFRRRLRLLAYLLAFRAAADLATLAIQFTLGRSEVYAWAWLIGQIVQVGMLCLLVCQLASRMLNDYRPLNGYAWAIGGIVAALTVAAWARGDSMLHQWLDATIAANMTLLGCLILALAFRKAQLEQRGIMLGAMIHTGGAAAYAMLWESLGSWAKWYMFPALLALLVWNTAMIYRKKEPMRLELAPKIEPTGVYREMSRRVQ